MEDDKISSEEKTHSPVGASGFHRFSNCAGSVQLIAKLGDKADQAGDEAALGTAAHELAALCLTSDSEAWEHTGKVINAAGKDWPVDDNMVGAVTVYLDHCRSLLAKYPTAKFFVEKSIQHPKHKKVYGTTDYGFVVPKTMIGIVDYKHGEGVNVEPTSGQLKYYAKLLLTIIPKEFLADDVKNMPVILWIVQPRQPHPDGPIRKYETTVGELAKWFNDDLLPAIARTEDPKAELSIGDWCRFCSARSHCPALKRETLEFNLELNPVYLTGAEFGALLMKLDAIAAYGKKIRPMALDRARGGEDIAHHKLVRQRANRVWKEGAEDALAEKFGDDAFDVKLKTPPNIEKMDGGQYFIARYAYTPDNGLTLVPINDKAKTVTPILTRAFEQGLLSE